MNGFLDGSLLESLFYNPLGLSIDYQSNLYIADCYNNAIRYLSQTNTSTLAGTGTATYSNGAGSISSFWRPNDVLSNSNGTFIVVADTYNNRLRQISCSIGYNLTYGGCNATAGFIFSSIPTSKPTAPTYAPTRNPTNEPSARPTTLPTFNPSARPSLNPTIKPTPRPTVRPTVRPTYQPTYGHPTQAPMKINYISNIVVTTFITTPQTNGQSTTNLEFYGLCIDPLNEFIYLTNHRLNGNIYKIFINQTISINFYNNSMIEMIGTMGESIQSPTYCVVDSITRNLYISANTKVLMIDYMNQSNVSLLAGSTGNF